jgi:hypothetical protein
VTLRRGLIATLLLLVAAVLATGVAHHRLPQLIAPIVWLGVLLVVIMLERPRYAPTQHELPDSFSPNGERFADPATGQEISVFTNDAGVREYRPSRRSL